LEPEREPTRKEVRIMIGIMIERVLSLIMENHYYVLGDVIRRQIRGGAIGLRSTGVVAKFVMREFDRLLRLKLGTVKILIKMYKRYVDDIDVCSSKLKLGTRLINEKLEWSNEWMREDIQTGKDNDKVTIGIIREIGDTIYDFIKLTSECPSDCTSGYVPILDLQCKVTKNRIVHKFYEKPMNTKYCILKKSACSEQIKYTTLVQETVRRMRNCNEMVEETEKDEILQNFVLKMRRSGYPGKYRQKVLLAAEGIMKQKIKDDKEGRVPLYRGREYDAAGRRLRKEKKSINWYNGKDTRDKYYMAPLIIDPTPDGLLKKELEKICREQGEEGGMWIKVIERGGDKLKNICKSNPSGSKECGRASCGICRGDKPGRCSTKGAGYRCCCLECKKEGIKAYYEGETGGNAHTRFLQHKQAVEKGKVAASALAKHMALQHGGKKGKFSMEVTGTFNKCLERLGDEGMRVRESEIEADILMNSKMEFHQPPISRVITVRGNRNDDQEETGRGARGARGRGRGRGDDRRR
jgi:hypothetical protein